MMLHGRSDSRRVAGAQVRDHFGDKSAPGITTDLGPALKVVERTSQLLPHARTDIPAYGITGTVPNNAYLTTDHHLE